MVCAGAHAPAHTIFAFPFYEGLSRYSKTQYIEQDTPYMLCGVSCLQGNKFARVGFLGTSMVDTQILGCEEAVYAGIIARVYSIRRFFFPPAIPSEYRSNFTHLYMDIGWFGILSGSSINFLSIYATRLGATGLDSSFNFP